MELDAELLIDEALLVDLIPRGSKDILPTAVPSLLSLEMLDLRGVMVDGAVAPFGRDSCLPASSCTDSDPDFFFDDRARPIAMPFPAAAARGVPKRLSEVCEEVGRERLVAPNSDADLRTTDGSRGC